MMQGVLMQPLLVRKRGATRVTYETDPYHYARGPIRSMQKYAVIALTTKGSDSIRPWFGTQLANLAMMNMYNKKELELFIRDQVKDATSQFFTLQNGEGNLTADDIINSVELQSIDIDDKGNVTIRIRFYPLRGESIALSLQV